MLTTKIFTIKNQITDKDFEDFHSIMCLSFPEEERRSREGFLRLCRECEYYKIISVFEDDVLIAFLTVWEFDSFIFGDHFAVHPDKRGYKLGSKLLNVFLESIELPFIIEVELPENEICKRRIEFYKRNGLCLCDFDYILPPLQEGFDGVPMKIMSYPSPLSQSDFEPFKAQMYKEVYNL